MLSEHEKASTARIAQLEESLKKKKQVKQISAYIVCIFTTSEGSCSDIFSCMQDDKTFSILRKSLGSFLGDASDDDFPLDD